MHHATRIATLAALAALVPLVASALSPNASPVAAAHVPNASVCHGPEQDSARCHARVVTDERGTPQANATAITGLTPAQLQAAYGVAGAPTPAAVPTIAIVDAYDNPNAEADLATYSTTFGLPQCTRANGCFKKVGQNGGNRLPRADQGWALEIALDVQAAHAMCPGCKILLVEASSNSFSNLLAAEDYATAHATVVSNSWGGNEFAQQTSGSYDGHFNRPGVPITVSSGDSGYGVEYPAASRYVTAVGGTTLTLNPDGSRASETAWSGAGSGCSSYSPKPAWQADAGCTRRSVADVSAVADPATGAAIYDSYGYQGQKGWFRVGGTSLSAPVIAGLYALAGNAGSTTYGSYPHTHTAGLFDVATGSNGSCGGSYLCTSVLGYDGPTGLGSPLSLAGF
jgi:subtilase family serine protease